MNPRTLSTCLTAVLVAAQAYAQVPAAPTDLVATRSDLSPLAGVREAKLTWNSDYSADYYELQRKEWSAGEWNTIAVGNRYPFSPFYDAHDAHGLKAATQYFYRVRGWNFSGSSAFGNTASVTTAAVPSAIFLEAEAGELRGPVVAADRPSYTGSGFVDFGAPADEELLLRPDLPQTGTYRLEFRYANGGTANRPLELRINNTILVGSLSFPPTGGWTSWSTISATISVPFSDSAYPDHNAAGSALVLRSIGASGPNLDSLRIVPVFTGARINYQPAGASVPAGYVADTGALYGGRGNGFSYGWNAAIAGETRDRNNALSPDQRHDTLVQTQRAGNSFWELAVPNGRYAVTLTMGDPGFTDSVYAASIEGVLTSPFTPISAQRWTEQFRIVNVTDGRLTIRNATGAVNNKFAFVEVYPRHTQTTVVNEAFYGLKDIGSHRDYVTETRVKGLNDGDTGNYYALSFGNFGEDWGDHRNTDFSYYTLQIDTLAKRVSLRWTFQDPNDTIYEAQVTETLASAPLALPNDSYSTWKIVRDAGTGQIQVYVDRGSGYPAAPLIDLTHHGVPVVKTVGWSSNPGFLVESFKVSATVQP